METDFLDWPCVYRITGFLFNNEDGIFVLKSAGTGICSRIGMLSDGHGTCRSQTPKGV